jgi:hypothetical protein
MVIAPIIETTGVKPPVNYEKAWLTIRVIGDKENTAAMA